MSQYYIEPHKATSTFSQARLAKVPERKQRSKSAGRSFWSWMKPFTYAENSQDSSFSSRSRRSPSPSRSRRSPSPSRSRRSPSPSITSRRSHDLDSTTTVDNFFEHESSRQSRASKPITRTEPSPLPRIVSLAKSHTSGFDSHSVTSRDSHNEDKILLNSNSSISGSRLATSFNNLPEDTKSPKSKTTIVVHLSKQTKVGSNTSNSNPISSPNHSNSSHQKTIPSSSFDHRSSLSLDLDQSQKRNNGFHHTRSTTHINDFDQRIHNNQGLVQLSPPMNHLDQSHAFNHCFDKKLTHSNGLDKRFTHSHGINPRSTSCQGIDHMATSAIKASNKKSIRNFHHKDFASQTQKSQYQNPSFSKIFNVSSSPPDGTTPMAKLSRSFEDVHRGIPLKYPEYKSDRNCSMFRSSDGSLAKRNQNSFEKNLFQSNPNLASSKENIFPTEFNDQQKGSNNLELNSWQVFKQPKYRNRNQSTRKIEHMHHLEKNDNCKQLVKNLGQAFHPNAYENQNSLSIFQQEMKSGFITSSKLPIVTDRIDLNPKFPGFMRTPVKEPIYAEIDEAPQPEFPLPESPLPIMTKRVSFSSTHQLFIDNDLFNTKKKVLPATLWGIVEVKCPLRERTDGERRSIAKLCYHAVKLATPDYSIKVLGKIDRSRFNESVYVVLEDETFEIRDGEGLVVARHRCTDISVIQEIEEDSNLLVYIGRCKFGGRIGMVLRFNKQKHLSIVVDFFR